MLSYCLKCSKKTESKIPRVAKTKKQKPLNLQKCVVCGSRKSKIIKEQGSSGLLSNLGIKTPLSKIPLI